MFWKHLSNSKEQVVFIQDFSVLDYLLLQFGIPICIRSHFLHCNLIIDWCWDFVDFGRSSGSSHGQLVKFNILILARPCSIIPWRNMLCLRIIVYPFIIGKCRYGLFKAFVQLHLTILLRWVDSSLGFLSSTLTSILGGFLRTNRFLNGDSLIIIDSYITRNYRFLVNSFIDLLWFGPIEVWTSFIVFIKAHSRVLLTGSIWHHCHWLTHVQLLVWLICIDKLNLRASLVIGDHRFRSLGGSLLHFATFVPTKGGSFAMNAYSMALIIDHRLTSSLFHVIVVFLSIWAHLGVFLRGLFLEWALSSCDVRLHKDVRIYKLISRSLPWVLHTVFHEVSDIYLRIIDVNLVEAALGRSNLLMLHLST